MFNISLLQILVYFLVILACVKPLGLYIAKIYTDQPYKLDHAIYRFCRIDPKQEMTWKSYLIAILIFNLLGLLAVYLIQRLQIHLPLNPQKLSTVPTELAFNVAASFTTGTNWQNYAGENTLSYFTQMSALTVQNFLSAATGISLLIALIRGIVRHETTHLGNFWVDLVRSTLYLLLPLACILAILLASQGVIQNFKPNQIAHPLDTQNKTEQVIPMGPVASQVAIKELGTNGGGFFNANSTHPFENPNPFTNFLEMLAILLIPASLCYTFGVIARDKRQGWAILAAMLIIFIPCMLVAVAAEQTGNPAFTAMGIDQTPKVQLFAGGNMEGKETRFGVASSALWASLTTATSNGSVNAMHDSFMPLGGLVSLWFMHLGEIIFGGVGSGLAGMLMLTIITVFIAGLMVGRTPEYLGKKIELYEMKMAVIAALIMPLTVLFFTAIATVTTVGTISISNPGAHGFTEILYAFTSMVNNNGSAFAGLNGNTPFYNMLGSVAMLIGRLAIIVPSLAIAGSLAQKKIIPSNLGTLLTHKPLFITLLIAVIIVLGALSFLPALALGPIVEHLLLWKQYGN